jgi:hypothetical protein
MVHKVPELPLRVGKEVAMQGLLLSQLPLLLWGGMGMRAVSPPHWPRPKSPPVMRCRSR